METVVPKGINKKKLLKYYYVLLTKITLFQNIPVQYNGYDCGVFTCMVSLFNMIICSVAATLIHS